MWGLMIAQKLDEVLVQRIHKIIVEEALSFNRHLNIRIHSQYWLLLVAFPLSF
jgi:hypothetical protein